MPWHSRVHTCGVGARTLCRSQGLGWVLGRVVGYCVAAGLTEGVWGHVHWAGVIVSFIRSPSPCVAPCKVFKKLLLVV